MKTDSEKGDSEKGDPETQFNDLLKTLHERPEPKSLISIVLKRIFPHKEIGWKEIGEYFTRYRLLTLPKWLGGFKIFLHELTAEFWHPKCHDHPWSFVTIILSGGYDEMTEKGIIRRKPGAILFRPAEWKHNVKTYGTSWSLIIVGPKRREWKFDECQNIHSIGENKSEDKLKTTD